ncbi:MAG TPA: transposase [Acetobacteraceae bacterium]|jgi:REP-associated tyrosine transposase|nr:transposase [Acetobacteraceae bacterium]
MPSYRRHRVPGGTYCFTVNLLDRNSSLLVDQIDILRDAVRTVRARAPFHIDAWVVLPEHLHCIWTLPPDDDNYSGRWRALKSLFAAAMPHSERRSAARVRKGERAIWQRRFWEHTIRDDRDYAAHMDYVHFNPVEHGLAACAADWPYSSFRLCVTRGLYPADWSMSGPDPAELGERR